VEEKVFFIGTGAFVLGILCGTLWILPQAAIVVGAYVSGLCFAVCLLVHPYRTQYKPQFLFAGVFLLASCAGILRAEVAPQALPEVFTSYINVKTTFIAEVVADPDVRLANQQVTVRIITQDTPTNILLFLPLYHLYTYGEILKVTGKLARPQPFASENGRVFRYDHYLAKKGIFATMSFASVYEVRPPSGNVAYAANILFSAKHTFVAGLGRALPPTYAALATGLLTGDQHQIDDTVLAVLMVSGLVWVVVLSGYHVMVIAEAVLWLLEWMPKWLRIILAGISVGAVVFATGASAPSLRGGIMVTFMLLARGTNRTYNSLRALGLTIFILLLWNPLLLAYDSGFQLSIIVTPALIVCSPIIESRLLWIHHTFMRKVVAVSIVAQLSILPLLVWQNGQLEVWSIFSNILVMPLVPVSMLCTVVSGFAGIFLPLYARAIGWPAHMALYLILLTGQYTAHLPYANTAVPPFSFTYVLGIYALLIWCAWKLKKK
jgi:competence protein ComEC